MVEIPEDFKYGFEAGMLAKGEISKMEVDLAYNKGFRDGVQHFVALAENRLVEELGVVNREELVALGKQPSWWQLALLEDYTSCRGPERAKVGEEPKRKERAEFIEEPESGERAKGKPKRKL